MTRKWTDRRDKTEWDVEAIPMMAPVQPGEPIPMIGETNFHVWFRSKDGATHQTIVDPATGMRLNHLTDEELTTILDGARRQA